jgi:two-component system, OmpR family, sensor histidine kinase KdpD
VFQPFQRLTDSQPGGGVGLGLAVSRGFLDAMGNELLIEDTPGGGTTMVIGLKPARATQQVLNTDLTEIRR